MTKSLGGGLVASDRTGRKRWQKHTSRPGLGRRVGSNRRGSDHLFITREFRGVGGRWHNQRLTRTELGDHLRHLAKIIEASRVPRSAQSFGMSDGAFLAHLGPDRHRVFDVGLVADVVIGGPVSDWPARFPDVHAGRKFHLRVHVGRVRHAVPPFVSPGTSPSLPTRR